MRNMIVRAVLLWTVLLLQAFTAFPDVRDISSLPLYKNPDVPVEKRVDDLLSRMTLEEKNRPDEYPLRL